MFNFFGKTQDNNLNRKPSEKEQNLILELRKISSADVEISLSDNQPVSMKMFNALFLETPIDCELTNEELMLLQVLRFMKFGMARIRIVDGQFTGELEPETHISVKL